ncbi:DUF2231 domain-containing protein [Persephonella sp.]
MDLISQLHPPVVHFAVALIIIGVLFDIAGFILKREDLKHAGFWTLLVGVLSMWGAAITGHEAEELVEDAIKGTAAYELLERHEGIGEILPWAATLIGILRVYLRFKYNNLLFAGYLIAGLILAGATGLQGRIGGKLVYEYGVGVKNQTDLKGSKNYHIDHDDDD